MTSVGEAKGSPVTPVGLTTEEIEALQLKKDDISLWEDVASVARAFWDSGCEQWHGHHLLMAVGNFKRQGGTIIRPKSPLNYQHGPETRQECVIDGSLLASDDEATWESFCGISRGGVRGFGVPTTTTLLSALWPGSHVIIDRRARDALVGLRGSRFGDWYVRVRNSLGAKGALEVRWEDYRWYRRHVLDTTSMGGVEPVLTERALFEVDRRRSTRHGNAEATWSAFGDQLVAVVKEAARSTAE